MQYVNTFVQTRGSQIKGFYWGGDVIWSDSHARKVARSFPPPKKKDHFDGTGNSHKGRNSQIWIHAIINARIKHRSLLVCFRWGKLLLERSFSTSLFSFHKIPNFTGLVPFQQHGQVKMNKERAQWQSCVWPCSVLVGLHRTKSKVSQHRGSGVLPSLFPPWCPNPNSESLCLLPRRTDELVPMNCWVGASCCRNDTLNCRKPFPAPLPLLPLLPGNLHLFHPCMAEFSLLYKHLRLHGV